MMKIIPKLLAVATAMLLALPILHAQASTVYTVGPTSCGPASTTWIDCYSMPLTIGTTTTTVWIEADYPPYTAEEFVVFHSGAGDYAISGMQVVSSITHNGGAYPTEIVAELTGVDGTVGTGTLDLKISYTVGRISRWATGLIANTGGGTVTIKE